jgi:hypothetical protein
VSWCSIAVYRGRASFVTFNRGRWTTDFEVLDRWFERVLTADSPDAVVEL